MKKKYEVMKKDEHVYENMMSEFDRKQLSDYSFKSKGEALGKNYRKLRRNKIIGIALSILGAILIIYLGFFIIEVIKGVNSRKSESVSAVTIASDESTTYPETTETTYPETSHASEKAAGNAADNEQITEEDSTEALGENNSEDGYN